MKLNDTKFIKWPSNLVIGRIILFTVVIASMTSVPLVLTTFISSFSILIICSICINALLFILSLLVGYWFKLIDGTFVMTPSEEHLVLAYQNRLRLEDDYNKIIKVIENLKGVK